MEVSIYNRRLNQEGLNMKSGKTEQIISVLMKEVRQSMDHEHFEDAAIKCPEQKLI
jgi:hypothetical protein